jgi:D-aspartate ligase
MSVTPDALLADSTWYGTLAAARDLGAHGVTVTLARDSWVAPARWSRHVSRTMPCPQSKDAKRFLAWLLQFGATEPGQVLCPTSDEVAWLIAAHHKELSRLFRLYVPPIDSLVRLLDKSRLARDASSVGLDVPDTCVPRDESDVERSGRALAFPLYVKPRAQVFGRGVGKGMRVENAAALLPCWRAQLRSAKYETEVLDLVADLSMPMLQSYIPAERVYTMDGFVDETGELYVALACVKVLQRPRGSGPGIIFEHAEIDTAVYQGLRRLFQATGFRGVFDAEFAEYGTRKLLFDINPRFYNHMAFETDRGLHLPWLAYLAAIGEWDVLRGEVEKTKAASVVPRAYIHRLPTALLLAAQRLARTMSNEDRLRWRHWISQNSGSVTDPARAVDDPIPGVAEVVMEAAALLRHPRAYLRGLSSAPN